MPNGTALPEIGAVLGIDVGFSQKQRSSAVCRLFWDGGRLDWIIDRFRALPDDQISTITAIAGQGDLQCAALDGPLRSGFDVIGRYRIAERMLTGGALGKRIGKPGQSSAPVGKNLNAAANDCARIVLDHCFILGARHSIRINEKSVVEAFPSSFLGVMLAQPEDIPTQRSDRSDRYFLHLAETGVLTDLLAHLLPLRTASQIVSGIVNHDDRAAFVCALTALAVAASDFTAVGDTDGWIILPPRRFIQEWAWVALQDQSRSIGNDCLYVSGAAK